MEAGAWGRGGKSAGAGRWRCAGGRRSVVQGVVKVFLATTRMLGKTGWKRRAVIPVARGVSRDPHGPVPIHSAATGGRTVPVGRPTGAWLGVLLLLLVLA